MSRPSTTSTLDSSYYTTISTNAVAYSGKAALCQLIADNASGAKVYRSVDTGASFTELTHSSLTGQLDSNVVDLCVSIDDSAINENYERVVVVTNNKVLRSFNNSTTTGGITTPTAASAVTFTVISAADLGLDANSITGVAANFGGIITAVTGKDGGRPSVVIGVEDGTHAIATYKYTLDTDTYSAYANKAFSFPSVEDRQPGAHNQGVYVCVPSGTSTDGLIVKILFNNNDSFASVSSSFVTLPTHTGAWEITAMHVSDNYANMILGVHTASNDLVVYSTNAGSSWKTLTSAYGAITEVAISIHNPAVNSVRAVAATVQRVYTTVDADAATPVWDPATYNLSGQYATDIAFDGFINTLGFATDQSRHLGLSTYPVTILSVQESAAGAGTVTYDAGSTAGTGYKLYSGANLLKSSITFPGTGTIIVDSGLTIGETVYFTNSSDVAVSGVAEVTSGGGPPVPCFPAGTKIATPTGYKAVETIQDGDVLLTADGREVSVSVFKTLTVGTKETAPYVIPANTFSKNVPCRDLCLSPWHAFQLVPNVWQKPAIAALFKPSVKQCRLGKEVAYFHFEAPNYLQDNFIVEGTVVESYANKQLNGANPYTYNHEHRVFTRMAAPSASKSLSK